MGRIHRSNRSRQRLVATVLGSFLFLNLIRWHGSLGGESLSIDLPIKSTVSIDSTKEGSTPCATLFVHSVTFNPRAFMLDGPGRPYLEIYEKQLQFSKKPQQRLLKIRFVLYSISSSCQPIYYHIHKNGGSTMHIKGSDATKNTFTLVHAYYTPQEQTMGREKFGNETRNILDQVQMSQQQGDTTRTIFTFLRDPVGRFLSAIGQALKLNKLGSCTRKIGTRRDTLQLLECVLSKIEDDDLFLDEHLEPQMFELYHGMMGLDLDVQVMDLKWIDFTLELLLGFPSREVSRRQTKGLVAGFNLSTALLTPALIHRICTVYYVDVLLLLETRASSTLCKKNDK